jgi:hypothetical protein
MHTTTLPCRPAVYSNLEQDFPVPVTSGYLFYTNVFGEGELWSRYGDSGRTHKTAGRWDDTELVEVWVYGEQWSAFNEPTYRKGYG